MDEKANILIVDDNISLCRTMSFVLGRKGCHVNTAKNGPEAIEKVKEKNFDIIFMDIKMPLMNGVETFRRIKKIRHEAVVMMMTGYSVENLVQQALEEGAYGIVYKPLDVENVVNLIGRVKETKEGALILIVDDDPGTCVTLKNILSNKGFNVGIAYNGDKAIAMAREKSYDIIFIDMKLPTINGLETYLSIKKANSEAVAIMMTAYCQEMTELVEAALKSHAYTCLCKPLDIEMVLRLVDEIRDKKKKRE